MGSFCLVLSAKTTVRKSPALMQAEAQDLAEVTDRRTPVMEHERRDGLGPACGPRRSWTTQGEAARSGVTVRVSPGERRDLARAPAREVGKQVKSCRYMGRRSHTASNSPRLEEALSRAVVGEQDHSRQYCYAEAPRRVPRASARRSAREASSDLTRDAETGAWLARAMTQTS